MMGKVLPLALTLLIVTAHAHNEIVNTEKTGAKVEVSSDNFPASMPPPGGSCNSSENLDMISADMEAANTNLMLDERFVATPAHLPTNIWNNKLPHPTLPHLPSNMSHNNLPYLTSLHPIPNNLSNNNFPHPTPIPSTMCEKMVSRRSG